MQERGISVVYYFDFQDTVISRHIVWQLLDAEGIAGPMILNLERKKLTHGFQRIRIIGHDSHHRTSWRWHDGVANRAMFFLHYGNAWRDRIVDEHRHVEII